MSVAVGAPDYSEEIQPILSEYCFHCHGPDAADQKAGLRVDTPEGAAAVIEDGEFLYRIETDDPDDIMPPPKSKLELTAEHKALLKEWLESGAEYEEHWSFIAPQRPDVPESDESHPVDAFIGDRLEKEGMAFSPEAAPERLIRRVTLDLTGLPPTPEEIDAFTTDYAGRGEAAYSELVDRLLSSPRYGEAMALPWLDAARFADTDGYQFDGPRYMWRWRDWVINAYNAHMPFDQFTIEQLAGDLLPDATLDQHIATGFNRNHRYNSEEGLVIEEFLLENAVDRVDTTSTLWMGLTVSCARCHDHKYDPISTKDYYQLIAFFNSIPEAGRALKNGNSEPLMIAPTPEQSPTLAAKEKAVADARAALSPGEKQQNGGPLVDRHLQHRYPCTEVPAKPHKVEGNLTIGEQAWQLDGKTKVSIAEIDKTMKYAANQRFSLSFWVKPDSTDDGVILSRMTGGDSRKGIEAAIVEGGKIRFDLVARWISSTGRVTTVEKIEPGVWSHITLTNDASQSANGQLIYINGQLVETEVAHNTNSNAGGVSEKTPLLVGAGVRPGSQRYKGAIRDIRLYKNTLWQEEVALLAAQYGGKERQHFSRVKMAAPYAKYVKAREDLEAYKKRLPTVMVMRESEQPKPTHIRVRGIYDDYGELVQRDVPAKLPSMGEELPRNRLGFAKWLMSPEHPLTARVAMNRYWQKYFGTGLVKTSEDFGLQGEKPSHPELLDWLAVEFRESGWDVAAMQKLIVTSRTYRQASHVKPADFEVDPANRLLSRAPRMRLSGHAIRDQALFVSGLLKEKIGGASVHPYQPANLWREMSMGRSYTQGKGDDLYRRSLYTVWKRTVAPPTMAVFDAADREACWVSRKQTNTPLQALTLLNETGYVEAARHLAVRMLGSEDPVGFGFRTATGREISDRERAIFDAAVADYRSDFETDENAATQLIAIGDSPVNKDFSPIDIATHTAVANVLLNLDEVITRE